MPWDEFITWVVQIVIVLVIGGGAVGAFFDWHDKRNANKKDH